MKPFEMAARLMLFAIAGCLFGGSAAGETFCALSVEVRFHDGRPARLQPVKFIDPSGNIVFDEQIENSTFQICDFGFGEHRLVVGSSRCYQTAVSGIELRLGRPIHLTVWLNDCPRHISRGKNCSVYLRVRNPSASALAGVNVSLGTDRPPGTTDDFGRVETYVKGAASTTAVLTKEGNVAEHVPLRCEDSEDIQRDVVLIPVAR